ncbi:hypothetical protein HNR44_000607 [Geomicrobium halophilum]|uniref:Uncharacterized protein n=1 Tax=Geomicrobium halophilum TaxID=549000 RepID=A0A841Q066_9BACL|nr:hypothetical protein [Geomicrobium halophilum]MBB6448658.1 hypothetical protein [Geomicrobium halophilum]
MGGQIRWNKPFTSVLKQNQETANCLKTLTHQFEFPPKTAEAFMETVKGEV